MTICLTTHARARMQQRGICVEALADLLNDFIGSLEHSVMPQVRRFNELEVEGTAAPIPVLGHIDTEPRLLRADRDFAGQLGASANSNTDAERRPAA